MIFDISGRWEGEYIYDERKGGEIKGWYNKGGAFFDLPEPIPQPDFPERVPFAFQTRNGFFGGFKGTVTDTAIPPHIDFAVTKVRGSITNNRLIHFRKSYTKRPEPPEFIKDGIITRERFEIWPDGTKKRLRKVESHAYYSGLILSENDIAGSWFVLPILWKVSGVTAWLEGFNGTFYMSRVSS